jgi:uncharacterized protein YxeA
VYTNRDFYFYYINLNKSGMKQIISFITVVIGFLSFSFTSNRILHEARNNPFISANKKGVQEMQWGEKDGKKVYLYTLTINTIYR